MENIGTKKVFTKMDLRWGYNNMRIKEGDEWKAVFMTLEGLFEPTVMFFGLTNSPATFQAMMNELLRDLVNTGKVVVFINDIIIATESEEGHDELVAEVVERLEENDLYIKPEKCKWKVREVEFFGSSNRTRGYKNGGSKSKRCSGMADAEVRQRCTKILGTGKLLSPVYRRICYGGKAVT